MQYPSASDPDKPERPTIVRKPKPKKKK